MVDFGKHLKKRTTERPTDPVELYDRLDRLSDTGPLRPAQEYVLKEWHDKRRAERDLIVKLHTGQGKTVVGLLMLQSRLKRRNRFVPVPLPQQISRGPDVPPGSTIWHSGHKCERS